MRPFVLLGCCAVGFGLTGCVSKTTSVSNLPNEDGQFKSETVTTPPPEVATTIKESEPFRVLAAWRNTVQFGADTTRGGAPFPCLSCRVYVFGKDQTYPLNADGGYFFVQLYDATPKENKADEGKRLEMWNFDSTKVPLMRKRDVFGEGYWLILPWSTYNPDIKKVSLTVEYRYQSDLPALPSSLPANAIEGPFAVDPGVVKGKEIRKLIASPEEITIDHSAILNKMRERVGGSAKPESTLPEPKSLPTLVMPAKP